MTDNTGNGMPVAMPKPPNNKLSLEWVTAPDGMALVFDKATWKVFKDAANRREQSAEHMILRAVVACLGTIVEDNMVLNRMLRPSGQCRMRPRRRTTTSPPTFARRKRIAWNVGWMRARADGRLELTETGEDELFRYLQNCNRKAVIKRSSPLRLPKQVVRRRALAIAGRADALPQAR